MIFDDDFSTVPHLRKGSVPENWAQLVKNSSLKSTEEFYDVAKTWFEDQEDPASQDSNSGPAIISQDESTGDQSQNQGISSTENVSNTLSEPQESC